jgi:hypothetical protein
MSERFYGAGEEIESINDKLIESENSVELLEKQLAELREKLRWIPVSERLPENNGDYELKNNGYLFVVFDNGKWYYQDNNGWKEYIILGIESWREIPELEDGE